MILKLQVGKCTWPITGYESIELLYNSPIIPAKTDNSAADDGETNSQTKEPDSNHRNHCNIHRVNRHVIRLSNDTLILINNDNNSSYARGIEGMQSFNIVLTRCYICKQMSRKKLANGCIHLCTHPNLILCETSIKLPFLVRDLDPPSSRFLCVDISLPPIRYS